MIIDVFKSFRRLPLWVQIWVGGILVPVNMASLVFWGQPGAVLIAVLAVGGMVPNAVLLVLERGFSKAMAFSHLVLWVPLVVLVMGHIKTGDISGAWWVYLWVLLVVDCISLAFDVRDGWEWWKGARGVA